jgi:hypothetical protein
MDSMILKTCPQGKIILLCYLDKALKMVSNSGALEQKVGEKLWLLLSLFSSFSAVGYCLH